MLCNEARSAVGNDAQAIDQVVGNFGDPDTLRQIDRVLHLRRVLKAHMEKPQLRDVVFLDIALENYTKVLCDRISQVDIGFVSVTR